MVLPSSPAPGLNGRGPNHSIDSLCTAFQNLNTLNTPFPKEDLEKRLEVITDAILACRWASLEFSFEFYDSLDKPTPVTPFYVDHKLLSNPRASSIDALDLEIPLFSFPSSPLFSFPSSLHIDLKRYNQLKAPKNSLQAKDVGLRVSRFADNLFKCLVNHSLVYRGLRRFTESLNLPDEFKLHLPRRAPFFNRKILIGDENYATSKPFAKGSTAQVRQLIINRGPFAPKQLKSIDQFRLEVGANLMLPPCEESLTFALKEFASSDQFLQEVGANLVLPPCEEILRVEAIIPCGLILEYADKKTLSELRDSDLLLDQKTIKHYLYTLAKALEFIHSIGFVHTDVKTNNVFCFKGGKIKLADFGYLKQTNSKAKWISSRFSTPPEKFIEDHIEPSGDIWALGALVFSILTKKRSPFIAIESGSLEDYKTILHDKNFEKDVSPEMLKALLNEQQLSNLSKQDPDGSILSLIAKCMSGLICHRPSAKEVKELLEKELEA